MATQDTCCTILPYFHIPEGNLNKFKAICEKFIEKTSTEPGCLYYGFSFNGNQAHCREGYESADALLTHAKSVGELFSEALEIVELTRLEVHGPAKELEKLRGSLADLNPQYFTLELGFRR